ncbi:MAG TPA: hypothetical protein VG826_01235 [Pirellulales bacterium]|nr:hypothetical protein [Pirellulales bacterium]
MSRRFQFSLGDVLLTTGVAAVIAATVASREAILSFVGFSALLIFIWRRPVLLRLWLATALGFGSGLLTAMTLHTCGHVSYISDVRMPSDELAGWGTGLVCGGLAVWRLFLSNPPE